MTISKLATLVASLALLGGCSKAVRPITVEWPQESGVTLPQERGVTIVVQAEVVAGGFQTQSVVSNYSRASINHLVLRLTNLKAGNIVEKDLAGADIDKAALFSNLNAGTNYRIAALAYKQPGVASADLISTTDAASQVDVAVKSDTQVEMARLQVKLIDVPFGAEATSNGVLVKEGGYAPKGAETITLK